MKTVKYLAERYQMLHRHQYLDLKAVTMKPVIFLVIIGVIGTCSKTTKLILLLTDYDMIMDHMVTDEEDLYPFPSSGFALLYLLLHSPRPVVNYTQILSYFCSTLIL